MLYLTCTTITSIDLAHYGVSRAKDRVSVKCGTSCLIIFNLDSLVLNCWERNDLLVFTCLVLLCMLSVFLFSFPTWCFGHDVEIDFVCS